MENIILEKYREETLNCNRTALLGSSIFFLAFSPTFVTLILRKELNTYGW